MNRLVAGVAAMAVIATVSAYAAQSAPVTPAATIDRLCDMARLPATVRTILEKQYAAWRIQTVSDLSESAHEGWKYEASSTCPGLVVGRFENAFPSFAVLLVSTSQPGYRFVIFSEPTPKQSYRGRTIEEWNGRGSDFYYLVKMPIDRRDRLKLGAATREGVARVDDGGDVEYGADLFFWTGKEYRHAFIDR